MRPSLQPLEQPLAIDSLTPAHAPILGTRLEVRPEARLETRRLHWHREADTAAFAGAMARVLAAQPAAGDAVVELHGPLGAGKTSFVRHLLRALGVTGRIKSPSFAVLETYRAGELAVAHLDCYRFGDPREWIDAGLRDVFAAPGLKLVEWPQKAAGVLPPPDLRLTLAFAPEAGGDEARSVTAEALTPRGQALLG